MVLRMTKRKVRKIRADFSCLRFSLQYRVQTFRRRSQKYKKIGVVSKIKLLFFLAKLLQFLFGGGPGGMFPGKMPFSFQCMNTFCAIFWRSGGSPARCSKSHFFAAEQQFSAKLARSITVVEQELARRAPNVRNSRKGMPSGRETAYATQGKVWLEKR